MDSRGNRAWGLAGIMDVSSVIVGGIIGGMSRDICKVRRPLDRTRLFLAVFSCWFVTKPFQAFLQIYVIFINRIRQIPLRTLDQSYSNVPLQLEKLLGYNTFPFSR